MKIVLIQDILIKIIDFRSVVPLFFSETNSARAGNKLIKVKKFKFQTQVGIFILKLWENCCCVFYIGKNPK